MHALNTLLIFKLLIEELFELGIKLPSSRALHFDLCKSSHRELRN
jgi:hypothetical protein